MKGDFTRILPLVLFIQACNKFSHHQVMNFQKKYFGSRIFKYCTR